MPWKAEAERLRKLTCAKWTWYDPDVIPAWVADMDFPPVPAAVEAVRALAGRGDFGYNFAAQMCIPQAFVDRQERRFGWRPDVEHVRVFCDVMQAVELALWLHTEPGDGVVLLTPVYPPFYSAIEACGCRVVDVPLTRDGWRLDPAALESAVDSGTRAVLLCNPHNPTGRAFTRDELASIAAVAEEHDLLVISDEIWADLVYPGAVHVPFASVSADAAARTVAIVAASKAFNLAGLRTAVAHIGHARIAEQIDEIPSHVLGAIGSPGAEATLAAWTAGDEWLAETLARLEANRDRAAARLTAELPEVRFAMPEATYLHWLDFSALELDDEPADWLLEHARVALSKGTDFGPRGAGFARLNFATTPELLDEILDRIVRAVRER